MDCIIPQVDQCNTVCQKSYGEYSVMQQGNISPFYVRAAKIAGRRHWKKGSLSNKVFS